MPDFFNQIFINPSEDYLTYNLLDEETTGGVPINVVATYDAGDHAETDDYIFEADPIFIFNKTGTQFEIEIDPTYAPATVGTYSYIVVVTGASSGKSKNLNVNLTVINEDITPVDDFVYKQRYFIERSNYRLNISKLVSPLTPVTAVEINGEIEYNFQKKNDLFDPIVASNLRLKLDASLDLDLQDLYSEEERTFQVELINDGVIVFMGFIKPDGIFADWVSDKWKLDIECYDGLSTLKNISFLNSAGVSFSGRKTALDIIYNCLIKTGLNLPIYINCQVYYDDYAWDSIFDAIFVNSERFYQDAGKPMDCEAVLNSILRIFNCSIIQMRGGWWIYRPIDLIENTQFVYYYYGTVFQGSINLPTSVNIGSHINGADIHHCNANQRQSIGASVQAYRVTYEYGAANSVFSNGELKLEGSGLNIPGWIVNNPDGDVFRNDNGYGLGSITHYFDNDAPSLLILDQSIDIVEGTTLKLSIAFSNESQLRYGQTTLASNGLTFSLGIGDKWLKDDGTWSDSQERIFIKNSKDIRDNLAPGPGTPVYVDSVYGNGDASYDGEIRAPYSGPLKLIIWRDKYNTGGGTFRIRGIQLSGAPQSDIKGREYTAQRKKRISTVTKSDVTVNNGDSISDLIIGTIFKIDADTPTKSWYRFGQEESKEILEINAEDNLRLSPRPMIIFEGDVYGYFPFLSLITIDGFPDKQFQVLEYSYNFSNNIMRLISKEFSNDYLPSNDFSVTITNNYGNETKVVIT